MAADRRAGERRRIAASRSTGVGLSQRRLPALALGILCVGLCVGCGASEDATGLEGGTTATATEIPALPAPETFTWGDQPISFSPPPPGWERQRTQSGGLMGVRFVKTGSVGERIHVAEYSRIGERDRCGELLALLGELEELETYEFRKRLQRARPYVGEPIHYREPDYMEAANDRLDAALQAFLAGDTSEAASEIAEAVEELAWIEYSLDEVVNQVIFEAEDLDEFGVVEVSEPEESQLAGEPSLELDFTLDPDDRELLFHGREVYVAHNNRLFVASFLGLPENRPLFDAIVETISFPEGTCEH